MLEKPKKEGAISFEDIVQDFQFEMPGEESKKDEIESLDLDLSSSEEESAEEISKKEDNVDDKPIVEVDKKLSEEESSYFKITKKLIDSGKWVDAEIEDEEGNLVKLSEYKNLTEEEYLELLDKQKEVEQEDIAEKYLKIEGVDEDKKRIANIVLNGGNLKEIFKSEQGMVKPFSEELGWDLTDENHQASIVHQHFLSQGMTDKQARALVKAAQDDLILDTQANQIVEFHQKAYSNKIKNIEETLLQEKREEAERLKEYRNSLSKEYKEEKLPDTLTKKLVDLATKENSEGELLIDELYNKIMQDPKEAKEVILFLADRETYLKNKTLETKKEVELTTFKKFNLIKDKEKKAPQEEKTETDFVFELPTN